MRVCFHFLLRKAKTRLRRKATAIIWTVSSANLLHDPGPQLRRHRCSLPDGTPIANFESACVCVRELINTKHPQKADSISQLGTTTCVLPNPWHFVAFVTRSWGWKESVSHSCQQQKFPCFWCLQTACNPHGIQSKLSGTRKIGIIDCLRGCKMTEANFSTYVFQQRSEKRCSSVQMLQEYGQMCRNNGGINLSKGDPGDLSRGMLSSSGGDVPFVEDGICVKTCKCIFVSIRNTHPISCATSRQVSIQEVTFFKAPIDRQLPFQPIGHQKTWKIIIKNHQGQMATEMRSTLGAVLAVNRQRNLIPVHLQTTSSSAHFSHWLRVEWELFRCQVSK